MNRASIAGALIIAVMTWMSQIAMSQQKSLKEQLVGTWTLASWEQRNADGTAVPQFGANPNGIAFFDGAGHYIITVMRSDRAKYAIDNFGQIAQSTAEENKATAQGTITYFGTYSLNDAERTIDTRVEASSFPNWNGTDQKRFFEVTEDQLKLTVRPPRGGPVDVRWKREVVFRGGPPASDRWPGARGLRGPPHQHATRFASAHAPGDPNSSGLERERVGSLQYMLRSRR